MKLNINFDKTNSLIPAIIQDYISGDIYMLGYMNEEALDKTIETGLVYFYSRSRKKLWLKGEKSGNKLKLKNIYLDCDMDSLLIKAELVGQNICHTGNQSCFYRKMEEII
jgi:phosphoribosyl-AMP cyclohydrolase